MKKLIRSKNKGTSINKLQKEINQKLNKETNTRQEKFSTELAQEKIPQNHGVG